MMALSEVAPRYRMLIAGEWVDSASGEVLLSINPATEETLTTIPSGDDRDIDRAVVAARAAFPAWRAMEPRARGQLVAELAARVRAQTERLAFLEALDSGNPVSSMVGDVRMGADLMEYFAGLASEVQGSTMPLVNGMNYTLREPYGVVGRIIPFNHPIYFATSRIAAALVAGNTVVLKPAEQTSLTALEFGRLITEVLPPGVVNIVTGDGPRAGAALVAHPEVQRIAFTGSVETGREILRTAADRIKVVTLELGGKNPMIIFPDVDIEKAATAAVQGMNFRWCQGQSCGSTSRVFIHRAMHDQFVEALVAGVRQIKVGLPTDPTTEMGALVSREHYNKVMGYVEIGKREGAKLLCGGKRPKGSAFTRGYFLEPTVFDQVRPDMRLAQEEIFGPVLSVLTWDDEEQLVADVNNVSYGLTAAILSRDVARAMRMAERVEAGYLWINGSSRHCVGAPFGGQKQSGFGREESLEELLSYTQTKNVQLWYSF